MTAASLITLGLRTSLFAIVLAMGMTTTRQDLRFLLREPGRLLRSLVSMQVVAPTLAALFASRLPLDPALKIALVMLALSPVPPTGPKKDMKAGGSREYAVSLLATTALVSVVIIPITLPVLGRVFGLPLDIPPLAIAKKVALSVLVPLFLGLGLHAAAPRHSRRGAHAVGVVGWLLLVACALPALIVALPKMRDIASLQGIAIVGAYAVCTLLIGHLLGGPEPEHRRVLALSTTLRHPGVAMALVQANFAHVALTTPAILLCLLVSSVVAAPYVTGSRRRKAVGAPVSIPH